MEGPGSECVGRLAGGIEERFAADLPALGAGLVGERGRDT